MAIIVDVWHIALLCNVSLPRVAILLIRSISGAVVSVADREPNRTGTG